MKISTCIAQLRTPIQLFQQIMCLLVILNSKTSYPKGALQQMEVEIAALYITMHITLQWTGRPRVWSWRYGFKYGYWLICTLFHNCLQFQDIHVFCFLLLFSLPPASPFFFQSSIPNQEHLRMERTSWDPMSQHSNIMAPGVLTLIIAICWVVLK